MNNINIKDKVGQIVARYPNTAEILNKYKIDYTFKGDLPLGTAIKDSGSSSTDIVGEIDLAIDEFKIMNPRVIYWENEPINKILDHIEGKHHSFMSRTMDEISALLEKAPAGECPEALNDAFARLKDEMVRHQSKEEEELFPLLRDYSENRTKEMRDRIVSYMLETEAEHDEAGRLFKKVNNLTEDFHVPSQASPFLKELYSKLEALEKDTFLHIHMENSILFKMI